jgi:hypothetical protein
MASPLEGSATFTFEGHEYRLKLGNRAFYHAEDVLGFSVLDAVDEMKAALDTGRNPRLQTIVALVYGGLKDNHPLITEDLVVEMFMSEDPAVREAVMKALRGAQMPDSAPIGASPGQAGKARLARPGGTGK